MNSSSIKILYYHYLILWITLTAFVSTKSTFHPEDLLGLLNRKNQIAVEGNIRRGVLNAAEWCA